MVDMENTDMDTKQMEVAETIMQQLGGRKFAAMTGAKKFIAGENSLSFKLPGGGGFCKNGVNYVIIVLDPSDTYTLTFARVSIRQGTPHTTFHSIRHDVYADSLRKVFTSETGLEVSL